MQNAKDTFFMTLQGRLAALNPARTIVVRGLSRPGLLVDENELPTAWVALDSFRLEWSALKVDSSGPMPLATLECTIRYATDGSADHGGMDRGRLLSAMDGELIAALNTAPQSATKSDYAAASAGIAPVPMATNLFWADPIFSPVTAVGERLERTATVQVFAYQEAGEL